MTDLRSQLSGRVCHRVNDPETATTTLGDMDPAAPDAARAIAAETSASRSSPDRTGFWHRARSAYVSEDDAELAARDNAHLTPAWETLISSTPAVRGEQRTGGRPEAA